MYTIRQGGRQDYNYFEIMIDTLEELPYVLDDPSYKDICTGSVVYVIETADVYMLNSNKEWVKQ